MNYHIYATEPTGLLDYALTEGVRLNNEGVGLARAGRFEEAIPLFLRAMVRRSEGSRAVLGEVLRLTVQLCRLFIGYWRLSESL